ncbi:MAG: type transporter [Verrucomicrobiales bacterium]|nr:type transporter [Verrucomicrobiales bacterium]
MFLTPIADRELRVASRKPGTYRLRLVTLASVIVIWMLLMTTTRFTSAAQLGHHVYNALGLLALAGCLFSGLFLTSDCVSEEKREGTLGLLFLTDLRGYDVVLGKLVATSAQAVFGLLAVLPILGLPLLLGGVTGGEFVRLILVLLTTLFWSLTIGLAVSTFCHEARHAMGVTFIVLLMLAGISPALWWTQKLLINSPHWDFLLYPSPCFLYFKAQENFYGLRAGPVDFRNAILLVGGTASFCLALSIVSLPRVWQRTERVRFAFWPRFTLFGNRPARLLRQPLLDANPMHWLGTRDLRPGRLAERLLLCLGLIWLLMLTFSVTAAPRPEEPFILSFVVLYGLHLMVKTLVAVESTRRVNEDRTSGALELLLVTPLPVLAILDGHHTALKSQFQRALRILMFMNLIMILVVLTHHGKLHMNGKDRGIFTEIFVGGLLVLFADFAALRWAGIWAGLISAKHYRAVLLTMGKIMLIPWVCIFLLVFMVRGSNGPGEAATVFGLWFALSLGVATWARRSSEVKLANLFRQTAADRYKS